MRKSFQKTVNKSLLRLWGNPNNEATSTATATVRTNGLTLICPRNANKQKEPRDTKCRKSISQGNHFSKKIHGKSLISLKSNSRWLVSWELSGVAIFVQNSSLESSASGERVLKPVTRSLSSVLKVEMTREKKSPTREVFSSSGTCDTHWFYCYHHFVCDTHWWCFKMCVWEIG